MLDLLFFLEAPGGEPGSGPAWLACVVLGLLRDAEAELLELKDTFEFKETWDKHLKRSWDADRLLSLAARERENITPQAIALVSHAVLQIYFCECSRVL